MALNDPQDRQWIEELCRYETSEEMSDRLRGVPLSGQACSPVAAPLHFGGLTEGNRFQQYWDKKFADQLLTQGILSRKLDKGRALDVQVGGEHYKKMKIQPIEFSMANGLNALEHTAVKYVVRRKGDEAKQIEDLQKAKHTIDMLIDFIRENGVDAR